MTPFKVVSIPKPCHQSWHEMTPVNQGRHCFSCSKTVTDFTGMTNDEIIGFLAVNNHVCGKFEKLQLDHINTKPYTIDSPKPNGFKKLAIALSFVLSVSYFESEAQNKPTTIQTMPDNNTADQNMIMGKLSFASLQNRSLKGYIVDEHGQPLPGVTVNIVSVINSILTDVNGSFTIHVPIDVIKFRVSYIGYEQQEVAIDATTDKIYEVKLKPKEMMLGEVVFATPRASFIKRTYYKLIKRPIRKITKVI